MKLLKSIAKRAKKLNNSFGNQNGITWVEYKRQWFEKNGNLYY